MKESDEMNATVHDDSEDMIGGLFAVRSHENELKKMHKSVLHQQDCSRDSMPLIFSADDDLQMLCESIKDCFVTGKWTDSHEQLDDEGLSLKIIELLHY